MQSSSSHAKVAAAIEPLPAQQSYLAELRGWVLAYVMLLIGQAQVTGQIERQ